MVKECLRIPNKNRAPAKNTFRPQEDAEERPPFSIQSATDISTLQQTIGNRSLQRLLDLPTARIRPTAIQRWTLEQARQHVANAPSWAGEESTVRAIQRQLRRLGLYLLAIDGDYGRGSDAGLVEAFGGDEFRTLSAEAVLTRLQAAEPPEGRRGEHALRYGEMFRDGVLDMTIGIGYDEALESDPEYSLRNFISVLQVRNFIPDQAGAAEIYQQAGRVLRPSLADQYFVRRNALIYTPPAGPPRPIHAVVRLVSNTSGTHGAAASQSFREGLVHSDTIYYAGHGRYGTGPDFDRNFASFILHHIDNPTVTDPPILDYAVLENTLAAESRRLRTGRSAWRQFLWRHEHQLIDVNFRNEGNLRMNTRNLHTGEFGGNLINWALEQGNIQPETGETGRLGTLAGANPERRYRVAVFNGCRTRDYETSLRSTTGFSQESAHLLTTSRTVLGDDDSLVLAAFLDSILQQQSSEQIVREMDSVQATMRSSGQNPAGTFRNVRGSNEPVIR